MKRKKTAGKGRVVGSAELFCLVMLSFLVNGCSYHDKQFSYFNMLDEKKRTLSNRQAAEKFWSSVRPVSTLSDSHYRLARHYQQKGEYDKAIKEFSKALRNDNMYCKAYNGIAMSYDALRRCEPAHASYERALQCAPDQAYVYNNYACSSLLCGNYGKGVDLLLKAEQLAVDNTRIKNNLRIAQKIELYGNISEYTPARQIPVPVAEPEPIVLLAEGERTLPAPVDVIPEKTVQTISHDRDVDEKPVSTDPAPTARSSSEIPETFLAVEAPEITNTGKLVVEKSEKQVPVPVAEPETPASLPRSEMALTAPAHVLPKQTVQVVSYDRDWDEKSFVTDPAPTAKSTSEIPEISSSVTTPEIADTVKLVAEKSEKQMSVPVDETESTAALPKSEMALTAPAQVIPEHTVQTVSYSSDWDEKSFGTDPAPTAKSTSETPEISSSVTAPKIAELVKLVAEKSKKLVLPDPAQTLLHPTTAAIEVSNGNGVTGMAGRSADFLREYGFKVRRITNAKHFRFKESTIYYKEGYLEAAKELAAIVPGAQNLEKVDTFPKASIGVKLVLGRDLVAMRFPEGFAGIAGLSGRKTDHLLTSSVTVAHTLVQY